MPYVETNWLHRCFRNSPAEIHPTFTAYIVEDGPMLSAQLRSSFSFLRRHSDRRYSAQSLMKLMDAADRFDAVLERGQSYNRTEYPSVVMVEVPYEFDAETEVKSGGLVACAVVLPDDRLMMAVNQQTRRQRVGSALFRFIQRYVNTNPVVWIHQGNLDGAQFVLSQSFQPRVINSRGAVAWSQEPIATNDDEFAVSNVEDWEFNNSLQTLTRIRNRANRQPRIPRPLAIEDDDSEQSDDSWLVRG